MKYIRIALTLAAPVWGAGCALAQSTAAEPAAAVDMSAQPDVEPSSGPSLLQGWQLGLIASHGRYREPGLMQVQGPRLGLLAARELTTWGAWRLELQGQWHGSAMQYSSPKSGELANVPDMETDLRITALHPLSGLLPQVVNASSPWQWAAYVGLAQRWHHSDLRGTTNMGYIGYRRLNERTYLPLGLQVSGQGPKAITARLEITPALHGTHTTYMTDIGGNRDATVPQHSQGWAMELGWQIKPGWRLSAHHRQWATTATMNWATTINGVSRTYLEPASSWEDTGLQIIRQF